MSVKLVKIESGKKITHNVTTQQQYLALRNDIKQVELVKKARQGDADAKKKLLQFNYSCYLAADGEPLAGCKVPSTTVGMDVDFDKTLPDFEQKMASVPELILKKKEELGLLMLEQSASKGYHLVFRRRQELSQEENLRWASDLLGVKYDEKAKDITRVFFATTGSAEDLLFLDPAIFDNEPAHVIEEVMQQAAATTVAPAQKQSATKAVNTESSTELTYKGFTFRQIEQSYLEIFNEGATPTEGDRNTTTYEMALALRSVADFQLERLEQLVPCYNGLPADEYRKTLLSALKEPCKGQHYRLRQVLDKLRKEVKEQSSHASTQTAPEMPKRLPSSIKDILKHTPDIYKPMAAMNLFPALGAHLHDVRFRYIDNKIHEATFMNVTITPYSFGKGSINDPIDHIMADIKAKDKVNRERERQWREQNQRKGQNKGKDPRPDDINVQCLMPDITSAAFSQAVIDNEINGGYYIYMRVDEIDCFKKMCGGKGMDGFSNIIRQAFDNADYGQERVSVDSVCGTAKLRFNFNASTTPEKGMHYMIKWLSDGTFSRLTFIAFERTEEIGEEMPIFGLYDQDESYDRDLKKYIDNLNACSGLIECPQARSLARKLDKENKEIAKYYYESKAYEVLSFRANVIAYLRAMTLYIMQGYKWSKDIENFVRWSLRYDLWCKMHYFGDELEKIMKNEHRIAKRGPSNMLEYLPEEFEIEQFRQMRLRLGKEGNGDGTLRSWLSRGRIIYDEVTKTYHKVKGKTNE